MHIVSPPVFHHAPRIAVLLALAVIACAVLGLLAFAVMWLTEIGVLRLDGLELAPFRWTPPIGVA